MWDVFSTREIAIIIWLLVVAPFLLRPKDIRKSLADLIKATFTIRLLFPVFLLSVYVSGVVFVLAHFDLWIVSLLKDSLFWFFSVGLLTIYKYVSAKNGEVPVRRLLYENMTLIVVLEFLLNTYTFALWIELLIVPVVTLFAMLNAYAERTEGNQRIADLSGKILAGFGMATIGYALYSAVKDYQDLGTVDTLRSFMLPILLSIAIVPAAYLMAVYTNYESLFVGLRIGKPKSQRFSKYCKWSIFKHYGFKIRRISNIKPFHLMQLQSKEDLNSLLQELDRSDVKVS